jgi:hypothetical protein
VKPEGLLTSNAEIIALIDAVLPLPVSGSTKNDLRSFRAQVQAGTIADDDRIYVIKLCKRLQQSQDESYKPSVLRKVDDERQEIVKLSPFDRAIGFTAIEFVAKASVAGSLLFFWFYSGYSLFKEHRVLDAIGALLVFPIGIIFGLGRFIGWW